MNMGMMRIKEPLINIDQYWSFTNINSFTLYFVDQNQGKEN